MFSASVDCFASYQNINPFAINFTTNDLTHDFCSALCRERNYSDAGVHVSNQSIEILLFLHSLKKDNVLHSVLVLKNEL